MTRNNNNPAWDAVLKSREKTRLQSSDFIHNIFDDFIELSGDRKFGDDKAILAGIATFHGKPVTIIGQNKGRGIKELALTRNGMTLPEGYRKSLRLMKQAEKFGRPIICFVDTPAAYSDAQSEERGQAEAIAKNLEEMSHLEVPILTIVLSQGGSGGALALSVANEIWSLENSYYSILPPEGFATILWKNSKRAAEAAKIMQSTTKELLKNKIIDKIIKEPKVGIDKNPEFVYRQITTELEGFFKRYKPGVLVAKKRAKKFETFDSRLFRK